VNPYRPSPHDYGKRGVSIFQNLFIKSMEFHAPSVTFTYIAYYISPSSKSWILSLLPKIKSSSFQLYPVQSNEFCSYTFLLLLLLVSYSLGYYYLCSRNASFSSRSKICPPGQKFVLGLHLSLPQVLFYIILLKSWFPYKL